MLMTNYSCSIILFAPFFYTDDANLLLYIYIYILIIIDNIHLLNKNFVLFSLYYFILLCDKQFNIDFIII